MKILFVTNAKGPDYMSDMVFHGGKSVFGKDFYETTKMWYMYDDVINKQNLYGRGFTIYGKIPISLYNPCPSNIVELIQNKFFDKIIYGSIWRCNLYFDLVSKIYQKEDIIVIDGEDEVDRFNFNYVGKSKYFKREYNQVQKEIYPINFSIPEELILTKTTIKEKLISDIIPNFNQKYVFENENDYYTEYAKSWYAHTQKKGGWDCLRHYEIMMNGTIPIFNDLENCPEKTLFFFPKKQIIDFNKDLSSIKEQNEFILDYCKNHLTTQKLIKYIIQ
jgi:hypothetical protein